MVGELGKVRTDMAQGFGQLRAEMADGFGRLGAEMVDRNAELLTWGLVFGATQRPPSQESSRSSPDGGAARSHWVHSPNVSASHSIPSSLGGAM
jgi:hypothetical protein